MQSQQMTGSLTQQTKPKGHPATTDTMYSVLGRDDRRPWKQTQTHHHTKSRPAPRAKAARPRHQRLLLVWDLNNTLVFRDTQRHLSVRPEYVEYLAVIYTMDKHQRRIYLRPGIVELMAQIQRAAELARVEVRHAVWTSMESHNAQTIASSFEQATGIKFEFIFDRGCTAPAPAARWPRQASRVPPHYQTIKNLHSIEPLAGYALADLVLIDDDLDKVRYNASDNYCLIPSFRPDSRFESEADFAAYLEADTRRLLQDFLPRLVEAHLPPEPASCHTNETDK